jgi:ribosomal protein S18 acetylase RimI-like enzyme
MSNGIEIKEIALGYFPEITEVHRAIMKGKISMAWMNSIERHLQKNDVAGYVALKDGRVAGFIIGEIRGPSFGLEKSGWIVVIEVHPHFMGTGIGKALARAIFQYFRENGVRDIFTATRWDQVDMQSFFISVGFGRSEFINLGKDLKAAK